MDRYPSQLLLSSKHQKELTLGPIFTAYGHEILVNNSFDTDAFGTFCGSTPRPEGPQITVKEKCLAGIAFAGKRQGLASEGSFGPHPSYPFLSCNEEWLIFIDLDQHLEIYGRSTTLEVCHAQLHYRDAAQLTPFLNNCSFGKQGLVLKDCLTNKIIEKGIQSEDKLNELMANIPEWLIETDLRAHMNPTRQKNIAAAGRDLLKRMYSFCPKCSAPDFVVKELKGKLPCAQCHKATETYQFEVAICTKCNYLSQQKRKDKQEEDPQFCQHCNP
jgi:hypothetical protein